MMRKLTMAASLAAGAATLAVLVSGVAQSGIITHSLRHAAAAKSNLLHISSHLAEAAQVTVDGKTVTAPGYGSTSTPVAAGHHVLKVISAHGVNYQGALDLKEADLMTWKGKGYWCVNLLESSLQPYSKEECQEDVTDAG
jgi:hypothetical protein